MNVFHRLLVRVTVLATALMMTACGSSETTTHHVGDSLSASNVDEEVLDTGDFPTFPQPAFGTAGPDEVAAVEGQRLAEFTVLPFEVDPVLIVVKKPTQVLGNGNDLALGVTKDVGRIADEYGMITGFSTTAANEDDAKWFSNAVIRFPDNASAADAAQQFHRSALTVERNSGLSVEEKIGSLPRTLVSYREHAGSDGGTPRIATSGWTAHGDYVIFTRATAPSAEKNWTVTAVAKALALQESMLEDFPATPKGKLADLEIDQDRVLTYTIPAQSDETRNDRQGKVFGLRGLGHLTGELQYNILKEAEIDVIANDYTIVHRASTPEKAEELMADFSRANLTEGYVETESPVGLPDARCMVHESSEGDLHSCMVVNGRYMGSIFLMDEKVKVRQAISAQYLILNGAK